MASRAVSTDLVVTGVVNATTIQQGGAAVALASSVTDLVTSRAASSKGVAKHGTNASFARPTGFASIEWQGTVEPTNAIDGDTWVDTDAT